MTTYPRLLHTVLDTTDTRALAELYRQLLGLRYRDGDEPSADGDETMPEWLVLVNDHDERKLAFQLVDRLPRTTWPSPEVPMQLHLDMTVPDAAELERQRQRAEALGARMVLDRSDDEEEPLYVFTDLDGHPFCLFVA